MADTTRFAIISHPRSGSHMLASALESRGDVVADWEPFNETIRPIGANQSVPQIYSRIFAAGKLDRYAAVGFILHRTQGRRQWSEIWHRVTNDRDLKIVLLHRRNLLARYVSNLIARRTNVWQARRPNASAAKVHINVDDFVRNVRRVERLYDQAWLRFAGHDVLPVAYEELVKGDSAWQELQCFLGLPVMSLQPVTCKQETRTLRDAVINYRGIVSRLRGTRYERYL